MYTAYTARIWVDRAQLYQDLDAMPRKGEVGGHNPAAFRSQLL